MTYTSLSDCEEKSISGYTSSNVINPWDGTLRRHLRQKYLGRIGIKETRGNYE